MEQSGGKLAKTPDGGGEDRLSALPDDVLVLILGCLDTTTEAARTSVLARRWRSLWTLLPTVCFHLRPDGNRIRDLLDVPDAPELRYISVTTKGAAADSATAWLPAAARRLAGGLYYRNMKPDRENGEQDRWGGNVQLPCFENATAIQLDLGFRLGLAFPSLGVFSGLTSLSLMAVQLRNPCDLGNVVSWPWCPCLQNLRIWFTWGLGNLTINSESLLQIELSHCNWSRLTIVAPVLQELSMKFSSLTNHPTEQIVNITAPQLLSLVWLDSYDPRYFHLVNLGQLQELQTKVLLVYGDQSNRENNHYSIMLLQRFQIIYSLRLRLFYYQDICHYQYLLEDITMLPQITFLDLDLNSHGHSFGASLFHLLKMCIGLRRLSLKLCAHSSLEKGLPCSSGCICDQSKNWKTDELVLGHLEDVRITGLRGAEHEIVFVQRLLSWSTVLKRLRIEFSNEMTDDKIDEFSEALAGFCRPEHAYRFTRVTTSCKTWVHSVAPED